MTVVIAGLGVLGGSIASALRGHDPAVVVKGIEPDPVTATRALSAGIVSEVDPSGEAVLFDADVVVWAAPLAALSGFLAGPGAGIPAGALLTDVVALNGPVLDRAARAGLADRWVSGAPSIVTPGTGLAEADAGLLGGVSLSLSAAPDAPPDLRRRAERFWRTVGAEPVWVEAREHDLLTAWTLLLPALVSNALAGALDAAGVPADRLAPPARAMTALAETDPARWAELIEASAPAVGTGLTSLGRATGVVADLLARREIDRIAEFMERTRSWARSGG